MAAGITYVPIATTTIGSNNTITFNSIPGTYTDLRLVLSGGITNDYWDMRWRFNNDSGTNYSQTSLYGDGTSAGSGRTSNATAISFGIGVRSNSLNTIARIDIMNYANTNTYKSCLVEQGSAASGGSSIVAGTWRSTAAITSIYVFVGASNNGETNLYAGTTATLYGIAAA